MGIGKVSRARKEDGSIHMPRRSRCYVNKLPIRAALFWNASSFRLRERPSTSSLFALKDSRRKNTMDTNNFVDQRHLTRR